MVNLTWKDPPKCTLHQTKVTIGCVACSREGSEHSPLRHVHKKKKQRGKTSQKTMIKHYIRGGRVTKRQHVCICALLLLEAADVLSRLLDMLTERGTVTVEPEETQGHSSLSRCHVSFPCPVKANPFSTFQMPSSDVLSSQNDTRHGVYSYSTVRYMSKESTRHLFKDISCAVKLLRTFPFTQFRACKFKFTAGSQMKISAPRTHIHNQG